MKDLTNSNIERQNILNNKYALQRIQDYIGIPGMLFEGEYRFTKELTVTIETLKDLNPPFMAIFLGSWTTTVKALFCS